MIYLSAIINVFLFIQGVVSCELKFAPFSTKIRKNPKRDVKLLIDKYNLYTFITHYHCYWQEQEEKHLSNLISQAFKAATRCVCINRFNTNSN